MKPTRRKKRKEFEGGLLKKNQPYIVIDTETGGLDFKTNALIEVSYAIIINRFIPVRRQLLMFDRKHITEKALEINNYKMEDIRTYDGPMQAVVQFIEDIDKVVKAYDPTEKIIPVGHNVMFDMKFIKQWMEDMNEGEFYWMFFAKPLDTLTLAREARDRGWILTENAKLETIAEYFGCERVGAHTAKVDVEMTIDVLEQLLRIKKQHTEEQTKNDV